MFIASCNSYKEFQAERLYKKWEVESKAISEQKSTGLESEIQKLIDNQLCNNNDDEYFVYQKKKFPKLKYRILQNKVKVTLVENLTNESYFHPEKVIFKDSIFQNKINCGKTNLTPLILTNKYKTKILGKLRYGFGSSQEEKNKENARAILESHHSVEYYNLPFRIDEILINKSVDSAIVKTSSTYHEVGEIFINKKGKWILAKELYHSVE